MPLITHWVGRNLNSKRDSFFFLFFVPSRQISRVVTKSSSRLTEARGFQSIDKYIDVSVLLQNWIWMDFSILYAGVINDRLNKFRRFIRSRLKNKLIYTLHAILLD